MVLMAVIGNLGADLLLCSKPKQDSRFNILGLEKL